MLSMEIFYSDLNVSAKREFDEHFGPPEDFNHEICPLAIYEVEDGEEVVA